MTGRNRRKILSVLLIITMVALAGCVGPIEDPTGLLGSDNDASGEEPIDAIPSEANFVAQFDPIGLVEDPTTKEIGNYASQELGMQNESFDSQINQSFDSANQQLERFLQDENLSVELSPDDFGDIIVFGDTEQIDQSVAGSGVNPVSMTGSDQTDGETLQQTPESNLNDQYAGVILELDLSESELTELFNAASDQIPSDAQGNFTQSEYNGFPMYTFESEGQEGALIMIDEGLHVLGPTSVAKDAADTYAGDSEPVSSDIVPNTTDNTYFSLGTSDVNETLTGVSEQVENIEQDPSVESILVTYSTDGDDTIQLNADLTLNSSQAPFQMQVEIEDQLEQFRSEDGEQVPPQFTFVEPVAGTDNFDVSSEQNTLSVSYEATTDEIKEFIDGLSESGLGMGPGTGTPDDENSDDVTAPPQEPDFPDIEVTTDVNEVDGQKQVRVEVIENQNAENIIVRDFLGNVSETFENPQQGDVYTVDVPPNTNIEIIGVTESGTEAPLTVVTVE
jgi:hypothetical protein